MLPPRRGKANERLSVRTARLPGTERLDDYGSATGRLQRLLFLNPKYDLNPKYL